MLVKVIGIMPPWSTFSGINRSFLEAFVVPCTGSTAYSSGIGRGYLAVKAFNRIAFKQRLKNKSELINSTIDYIRNFIGGIICGYDEECKKSVDELIEDDNYDRELFIRKLLEASIIVAGLTSVTLDYPPPLRGYLVEELAREMARRIRGEVKKQYTILRYLIRIHAFINKLLRYWGIEDDFLKDYIVNEKVDIPDELADLEDTINSIKPVSLRNNLIRTVNAITDKINGKSDIIDMYRLKYPMGIYIPLSHILGHIYLVYLARAFLHDEYKRKYGVITGVKEQDIEKIISSSTQFLLGVEIDELNTMAKLGFSLPLATASMILLGPYYTRALVRAASSIEFYMPLVNASVLDNLYRSLAVSGIGLTSSHHLITVLSTPRIHMLEINHLKFADDIEFYDSKEILEPYIIYATNNKYLVMGFILEHDDIVNIHKIHDDIAYYDLKVLMHNITVQARFKYYNEINREKPVFIKYIEAVQNLFNTIANDNKTKDIGERGVGDDNITDIIKNIYETHKSIIENMKKIHDDMINEIINIRSNTKRVIEFKIKGIKKELIKENIMLDSFSGLNPEQTDDLFQLSQNLTDAINNEKRLDRIIKGKININVALIPHEGVFLQPGECKILFPLWFKIGDKPKEKFGFSTIYTLLLDERGKLSSLLIYVVVPSKDEKLVKYMLERYQDIKRTVEDHVKKYIEIY